LRLKFSALGTINGTTAVDHTPAAVRVHVCT
jgi:hypothetical protein